MVFQCNGLDFVDVCVLKSNGGYSYYPRLLRNGVCVVEAIHNEGYSHWETWKLLKVCASERYPNRWGVRFPSNSQFGTLGWCYPTRAMAENKMEELLNGSSVKN